MFREIWIPTAVRFGVPETEFWKMNPKTFARRLPYFEEMQKRKRQDLYNSSWLSGQYVHMAVAASLSKSFHYPEEPPDFYEEEIMDEEEIVQNAADAFRKLMHEHNARIEEVESNARH